MGLRKSDITSQVKSIDWKDSVRCVIDGDGLAAHSRSGNVITGDSVGNIGVQDGVTLANGDEVALDYAAPNVNTGLYVVDEIGGAGVFQLTRRNDFDTDGKVTAGVRVPIEEGTAFGGANIKLETTGTIQINVTALDFELDPDAHTIASHSDTDATGSELNNLTDGTNADALHSHVVAFDIDGEVLTDEDVPTTIASFTPVDDQAFTVWGILTAFSAGASKHWEFLLSGTRSASVVTVAEFKILHEVSSAALVAADFSLDLTGALLSFRGTGILATDINWRLQTFNFDAGTAV